MEFNTQENTTPNGYIINDGSYDGSEVGWNADYLQFFEDNIVVTRNYGTECVLGLLSGTYIKDKKDLALSFGLMDSTDCRILFADETTLVFEIRYRHESTTRVAEIRYVKPP